jgi:hypothetical protein
LEHLVQVEKWVLWEKLDSLGREVHQETLENQELKEKRVLREIKEIWAC